MFSLAAGSNNVANLNDDAPFGSFVGTSFYVGYFGSSLYAPNAGFNALGSFDNQAVGYQTINILGGNSKADTAILTASQTANDQIFATGDSLDFTDPSLAATAALSGVDTITANIPTGATGTDTVSSRSIDIVLTLNGPWVRQVGDLPDAVDAPTETIASLNRSRAPRLLRFHGNDNGLR